MVTTMTAVRKYKFKSQLEYHLSSSVHMSLILMVNARILMS